MWAKAWAHVGEFFFEAGPAACKARGGVWGRPPPHPPPARDRRGDKTAPGAAAAPPRPRPASPARRSQDGRPGRQERPLPAARSPPPKRLSRRAGRGCRRSAQLKSVPFPRRLVCESPWSVISPFVCNTKSSTSQNMQYVNFRGQAPGNYLIPKQLHGFAAVSRYFASRLESTSCAMRRYAGCRC